MTHDELTTLLYQSGALTAGRVIAVEIAGNAAFNSNVPHLTVSYSADATWDHANGSSRSYWWPKLQTIISAIREHDCIGLLR